MKNKTVTGTPSGVSSATYLDFEKPLFRIQVEIDQLERDQVEGGRDFSIDLKELRQRLKQMTKRLYSHLTAWETVLVARHPQRPLAPDYLRTVVRDFCEIHGDRLYGDDKAIITGFGRIGPHKVMIIGHNKGKDTAERITCNFGCAHPEGYRKALRAMKMAEKFGLPVVCMIDTQGAFPGVGAEERGISSAIAVNLREMSRLKTPIVCCVIGEGGSGGALGIGVGDRVAMFEHSFYSVISPEGCAAILWRTGEQRKLAAESLKLTAKDLKRLNIVDSILKEPLGGAHREPADAAATLEKYFTDALRELKRYKVDTLLRKRYERIRGLGSFFERASQDAKAPAKSTRRAGSRTTRTLSVKSPASSGSPVKPRSRTAT
ncbi:MAG: acetyl-CoA carboxylase carboxyltransferase subunit alpha [Planctomycetes bacterium]|nr:acetyl-CoA carboxylase carboxyltransferase subunit alpha [Planctomycetota bacterium]